MSFCVTRFDNFSAWKEREGKRREGEERTQEKREEERRVENGRNNRKSLSFFECYQIFDQVIGPNLSADISDL